jgi:hypothetical protein
MIHRRLLSLMLWGLAVCLLAGSLGASRLAAQVSKGSISGTVTDPTGAAVPDAEVTAVSSTTGAANTTRTESTGLFRLPLLGGGSYTVTVAKEGFRKLVLSDVEVRSAQDNSLGTLKLEVGQLTTVIEVSAAPPILQTSQAQVSSSIKGSEITVFPGIGENQGLDRLVLMLPGVINSRDNSFSNSNGADFAVNGIRGRNNDQQIDGQANNDNSVGGPSMFIGNTDFVQEYQVVTNNFGPEYGRNAGSVVNIIMKSGTNSWHGAVNATESNSALGTLNNVQKAFEGMTKLPQFNDIFHSYSAGGPVVKDRMFIFAGFDHEYMSQKRT